MYCPKCGKENDDGAQFCASCGERLEASQDTQQAPATSTAATEAVTTGEGSTAVAANKTGRVIGIVVVVVVVAVVAIAGFATNWFGPSGAQPDAPSETGSSAQESPASQGAVADEVEPEGVKASVEEYSWEELSQISSVIAEAADEAAAIEVAKSYNLCTSDGELDGTQEKSLTLTDGTETSVQIAGFRHDNKTGGGKAGITFIFKDAIGEKSMNDDYFNTGGWEKSEIRSELSSDGLARLPKNLRRHVVAVDKLTNNVGETTSVSSVTATSDKLWLFSCVELCGLQGWPEYDNTGYKDVQEAEGTEYKLFRDTDVYWDEDNDILAKTTYRGTSCIWWERSPYLFESGDFMCVGYGGYPSNGVPVRSIEGVVPGFCI